jgi:hypothetical protein
VEISFCTFSFSVLRSKKLRMLQTLHMQRAGNTDLQTRAKFGPLFSEEGGSEIMEKYEIKGQSDVMTVDQSRF